MCASVHADFCRPTGLESARPGLAPTHYGTTKVAINYQHMEKLSTTFSVGKRSDSYTIHIGAVTLGYDAPILTRSHWHLYLS